MCLFQFWIWLGRNYWVPSYIFNHNKSIALITHRAIRFCPLGVSTFCLVNTTVSDSTNLNTKFIIRTPVHLAQSNRKLSKHISARESLFHHILLWFQISNHLFLGKKVVGMYLVL